MQAMTTQQTQNFITDLDAGYADEVARARFTQGAEDEIITRFYTLWGRIIRSVENRRDTTTKFFFVTNPSDIELFYAHYTL